MEVPFFDLKAQYSEIQTEIDDAIRGVFQQGQFIGGDIVQKFETDFASLHQARHCIGTGNGTDALLIALKSLGIGPGDEVIVPAFGWISAAEMVTLAGAKPVFADVLPSGVIDPDSVNQQITPETKGVVLIHLYGQAAAARALAALCKEQGIFLIEDCAQAHLTEEYGLPVGTIGTVGTFSYYPTKNLGAYGDGGSIVTNEEALAASMRRFANHGGLNDHVIEGMNSRIDPIQAAVLSVKINHLRRWTTLRIKNAALYCSLLGDISEVSLPLVRENTVHTFHQFVIRSEQRDALKEYLATQGIRTLIHYPVALPNLVAYRYLQHQPQDFPNALKCQNEVLSLPVYPELSEDQLRWVCKCIHLFFNRP